ncbi:ribulose phosphate epimerase [Anaerococcus rubeinfantis]|uniref:ribulose phosphate epimerase n=1 Tax=Anaerococcus rubeinfantis TaxID=1720199 RepID=UPI00073F629B|nr:ribulose phosphate epimerase [Anaerococcus rubeinfantis]
MNKFLLAPSMGCCDLFDFAHEVEYIDKHADILHIDIKDGNYVKTFSIGPDFMRALKDKVKKPMDAHLMVKHPQNIIEDCIDAGATYVTVHSDCIESDAFVTFNKIISLGAKAGVAINPATPIENIKNYLHKLSKVTVMLVDAGYAGQEVIPITYEKIKDLVRIRKEQNLDFLIEADGSMNKGIYKKLKEAGADAVVLGPPALWNKADDIEKAWEIMLSEIDEEIN